MQLHKALAVVVIAAALTTAHSQDMKEQARTAGIADAATTVLGLAAGAAEANPLGAVIAIGVKPLVLRYIEGLPQEQRPQVYALAASVWGGVAANNVCVIASIVSGGGLRSRVRGAGRRLGREEVEGHRAGADLLGRGVSHAARLRQ